MNPSARSSYSAFASVVGAVHPLCFISDRDAPMLPLFEPLSIMRMSMYSFTADGPRTRHAGVFSSE
ncbi:hypothetical protein J103_30280 [Burkholderia pseudomallei MSHR5855]|nr:hypothetical protein J103_30280 [Burkholderia pseudomallei MSHR5855]